MNALRAFKKTLRLCIDLPIAIICAILMIVLDSDSEKPSRDPWEF